MASTENLEERLNQNSGQLQHNSDELHELANEMYNLGGSLSQSRQKEGDVILELGGLQDKIIGLGRQIDELANKIGSAPVEGGEGGGQIDTENVNLALRALGAAINNLAIDTTNMSNAATNLPTAIQQLNEVSNKLSEVTEALANVVTGENGETIGGEGGGETPTSNVDSNVAVSTVLGEEVEYLDEEKTTVQQLDELWGSIYDKIVAKNAVLDEGQGTVGKEVGTTGEIAGETKKITDERKNLNAQLNKTKQGEAEEKSGLEKTFDFISNVYDILTSILDLPGKLIGAIKEIGKPWLDINDSVVTYSRNLGLSYKQAQEYNQSALKSNYALMGMYGKTEEQILAYQQKYTETMGTVMMLNNEQKEGLIAVSNVVSDETMMNFAQNASNLGISLMDSTRYMAQNVERAKMYGLNAQTASKAFAENIKAVNNVTFKNGINGISKMTMLSERLKISMQDVEAVASKFQNVESAIDVSAKLQVMGSSFGSTFGNPLEMMNLAFTDAEGIFNKLVDMVKGKGVFNSKTGDVEIAPILKTELKAAADALGVNFDNIMTAARKSTYGERVDKEISSSLQGEKHLAQQEWIKNNAQYDSETQQFYVNTYDANTGQYVKKFVKDITANNFNSITKATSKEDTMYDDVHQIRGILCGFEGDMKGYWSANEGLAAGESMINTRKAELMDTPMQGLNGLLHQQLVDQDSYFNSMLDYIAGISLFGDVLKHIVTILGGLGLFKFTKWGLGKIFGGGTESASEAVISRTLGGSATQATEQAVANGVKTGMKPAAETIVKEGAAATEKAVAQGAEQGASNAARSGARGAMGRMVSSAGGRALLGGAFAGIYQGIKHGSAIYDKLKTQAADEAELKQNYNYSSTDLMGRLKANDFEEQAKTDYAIASGRSQTNSEVAGHVGAAVMGTVGAALGSMLPGFGSVLGGMAGMWIGEKVGGLIGKATVGKTEGEQLGVSGLAQSHFETTKMGLDNIKTDKDLQQQAYIAVIAIHDLMISKYNEDKGLLLNGQEKDRGFIGNVMHSTKNFVSNLLGFAEGGDVPAEAQNIPTQPNGDNAIVKVKAGKESVVSTQALNSLVETKTTISALPTPKVDVSPNRSMGSYMSKLEGEFRNNVSGTITVQTGQGRDGQMSGEEFVKHFRTALTDKRIQTDIAKIANITDAAHYNSTMVPRHQTNYKMDYV